MAYVSIASISAPQAETVSFETNWGVSIAEARAQRTPLSIAMAWAGYATALLASLLVIPIIIGLTLFQGSTAVLFEIGVICAIIAIATFFRIQSQKGPKNAIQIDYEASELRLGSMTTAGAFVRQKVCALRNIEDVTLPEDGSASLTLHLPGENATMSFENTRADSLQNLADKIKTAAEEARNAPMRSRIQSRVNGFEANVREIGQRVRSRVTSSFA